MDEAEAEAEELEAGREPEWARRMERRILERIEEAETATLATTVSAVETSQAAIVTAIESAAAALTATIEAAVAAIVAALSTPPAPGRATGLRVSIGGKPDMSDLSISVDVANETLHVDWVDDKGDITSDIPAGAQISVTSSDTTVATVAAGTVDAAGSGADFGLGFHKAGTVTFQVSATDASGNVLPGFATITTDTLTLTPGAATGLEASFGQAAPVPVTPSPVPPAPQPTPAPAPAPEPTPPPAPAGP